MFNGTVPTEMRQIKAWKLLSRLCADYLREQGVKVG